MMRINTISALLLFVAAVGCQDDGTSRVTFDLAPLYQHAAATHMPIDGLELLVTAEGLDYAPVSIDPTALTFDIVVPSGPARRFEIEAWMDVPGMVDRFTTYWGFETIDLVAGSTVDLIVPVTPAGRLIGTVTLDDGTAVPQSVDLVFTPSQPMPNMPASMTIVATNGAFSVPMPAGDWMVAATVTVGSTTYSTPADAAVYVIQGEALPWPFVLFSDAAPVLTTVSVVNSLGEPQDAMQILVHDPAGVFRFEAVTNMAGQVMVDALVDDMVTVVDGTDSVSAGQYRLYTAAGIQPGSTIRFSIGGPQSARAAVGAINTGVSNPPALATLEATAGNFGSTVLAVGASPAVNFYADDISTNNDVNLLGFAYDSTGGLIGFAQSTGHDSTLPTGSTTMAVWDENPPTVQINPPTFPAGVGSVVLNLRVVRSGVSYEMRQFATISATGAPTTVFKIPSGFPSFSEVEANTVGKTTIRSVTRRFIESVQSTVIDFDLVKDMLPETTNIVLNETDANRPVISWTNPVASTELDFVTIWVSWSGASSQLDWRMIIPPGAVTSFEVPDILPAPIEYHPQEYGVGLVNELALGELSITTGYADFINQVGPVILDRWSQDRGPVQDLTIRLSIDGAF